MKCFRCFRSLIVLILFVSNLILLISLLSTKFQCTEHWNPQVDEPNLGYKEPEKLENYKAARPKPTKPVRLKPDVAPSETVIIPESNRTTNIPVRPILPIAIVKELSKAVALSRSAKTKWILRNVLEAVTKQFDPAALKDQTPVKQSPPQTERTELTESAEFCSEKWSHSNCTVCGFHYRKPCQKASLISLVSVIINHRYINESILSDIIEQVLSAYPGIPVIVSCNSTYNGNESLSNCTTSDKIGYESFLSRNSVRFVPFNESESDYVLWGNLTGSAGTKYVLLLKDIFYFNADADLERLIDALVSANADIVGGSYRLKDGRWFANCYQTVLLNYTLKVDSGYHFSHKSCMYCDYVHGPILAKRSFLNRNLQPTTSFRKEMFFVYWYLKLQQNETLHVPFMDDIKENNMIISIISCPDVMFHTEMEAFFSIQYVDWWIFAGTLLVNRIRIPGRTELQFDCKQLNQNNCIKWALNGLANPICCSEWLMQGLLLVLHLMEHYGIRYEIISGTLLGAIKVDGVLAWERDADVYFNVADFFKFVSLQETLRKQDLYLKVLIWPSENATYNSSCNDNNFCGEISVYAPGGWRYTFLAIYQLPFNKEKTNHEGPRANWAPSLVRIGPQWVFAAHNPAIDMRNQYKDDIFAHLEHAPIRYLAARQGDKAGNQSEGIIPFLRCPIMGFHGCLSNFYERGNLHFRDIFY